VNEVTLCYAVNFTALSEATSAEMILLLASNGADMNASKGHALHSAAGKHRPELLKALIENGADVQVRDVSGWPILQTAAMQRNLDVVKLLIEKGADVRALTSDGGSPVITAANYVDLPMIRLLVEAGAPVDSQEKAYGWTALLWACRFGRVDIINWHCA
jgi:ankyrin repeat protein